MRALILSVWEDTGGVGIALKRALERHTSWEVRFVHRHHNYISYPTDIYWDPEAPKPDGLDALFAEADVIHVMERWESASVFDGWRDKPLLMHHHGTHFRVEQTQNLIASVREYGAKAIVSTPDLLLIDESLEWLPNPCDIPMMERIRRENYRENEYPRAAHSPTNRGLKGTEQFLRAAYDLRTQMGIDVIEWVTWDACLDRKSRAEMFFDQLHIGYALSGIEAMAMGIPVIGGAEDPRILALMRDIFGDLPFVLADRGTLGDALRLLLDPAERRRWGEIGRSHVAEYHDEARVARQLAGIYEQMLDTH